jgi:hypothetical protein
MRSLADLSTEEMRTALTPERVRVGMIIQAGLGLGGLFFFSAILFVAFLHNTAVANTESLGFLTTLTQVVLGLFVVFSSVQQFVYRSRFSAQQLEAAFTNDFHDQQGNVIIATPAEKAISFIRTTMLIRTAMFEGPAFFGLAVLMMAAQNGLLLSDSWLWINTLPLAVFIALIVITFPTKEKVVSIFENNIKCVR